MNTALRPSRLGATWFVFRKEIRSFFLTPLAYVFLAAFLFLAGLFFSLGLAVTGEASLRAMMSNLGITLLFCLPMVTMRQLAEETRSGTLELLMTAPMPIGSIILGKWLATCVLCAALLLMTFPFPLVLQLYGEPDLGVLATSYLGLMACCAAFAAAGLFTSSLARDQMVAAVVGILVLLPFWMASPARGMVPEFMQPVLDRMSFLDHLRSFAQGILDSSDILWFSGFTFIFLFLTWRSLESRRWR